ncbi:e85bc753-5e36-41d2-8bce-26a06ac6fdcd-CDS [Sclerotinia trifoliorum]|uniref:E85bc753-5e36-41d2-8bce-26a06ac6fdcd-CDS n=1 Tax=Sclerotinia trifoliorum TaxID=28548 RepID=A0A8H2W2B9_9HELO|nr:e85bc753-5e36-41d2-8bce-26a06ac6fdcd-CDS [Sclerotinia trifoliorum]
MSIQSGREPLGTEESSRELDNPLTRPPDFPPSPHGRDHLSPEARAWEEALDDLDKQLDYEDVHGPGTSQHPGSRWKYIPSNPPEKDGPESQRAFRKGLLEDARERIMREVKRDFAAQGRVYRLALSESSESSGEEKLTDTRSSVDVTRKRDAKEHAKKDRGEHSVDRPDFDASEGSKDSSIEAKIRRRDDENQKLRDDVLDEWSRRVEATYEKEDFSSDSENEEQDDPKSLLKKVAELEKKRKKVEIVDSPTETTDEKEEIHWLDALHAEKLSPTEFKARMDAKLQEYDRSYKNTQREDAERAARTAEWRHLSEEIAAARERRMQTLELFEAWKEAQKPKSPVHESAQDKQRAAQMRYDLAFHRNKAFMEVASSLGRGSKGDNNLVHKGAEGGSGAHPSPGGKCPIHNEPHSPGSATDQNIPWDKISYGMKMMGVSQGGESIAPPPGGQRPFHNEPQSSSSAAKDT